MRKFLTTLALGLLANIVLDATPAAAATMTLPVYGRDRNAVPDKTLSYLPINATLGVADADGDGRDDLLYFGALFDFENQINIPVPILAYHNLGSGNFELVAADQLIGGTVPDTKQTRLLLAAELNGDGRLDVIVANAGDDFEPYPGEENLLFLSSSGGLALATAGFPQFSDFSHGVAAGDIDGDGDTDIYFANTCCGIIGPYFLLNNGAGSFTFDQSRLPSILLDVSGGRPGQLGDLKDPTLSAEIVDVNGDGHRDLALGLYHGGGSRIIATGILLLNDGTGDYSDADLLEFPPGEFNPPGITLDFLAMDVNQDGLSDFIVSEADQNQAGARLQVLISNGDGTFRDESFRFPTDFPFIPNTPDLWIERLDAIDLNSDGASDVLVQLSDTGNPKTVVFVNNGFGFFQEIPDGIISNTPSFEPLGILDDLPLFPINIAGQLLFIGPEFNCVAGSEELGCITWNVMTSVYRPTGSTVVTLNFGPGAIDDVYAARMNRALDVSAAAGVLANDIEPDGQPMTASLVGGPGNGTVTLNANGGFTYEADRSFMGRDSFTYKTSDGDLDSNVATVTVTVEAIALPWLGILLDD